MHGFNRPLGPIGSNVVAPLQATSSGMMVTANKLVPGQEAIDFKGYFKVESFPHNSTIYRPGDTSDRVYLLKSGRVRLMRIGKNSTRSVVSILRPGDLFGELFRPEGTPIEEMAVAAGEAEVWSIEGRDFRAQLEARPALAVDVVRAYADRVRSLRKRVLGLTFKEVPARLADTLLTLVEAHGERCPHGGETDLRGITQQDLADLVGASRSFVSTLINEMKREGVLGNVGRILCVRDQKALRKLASKEK
ncbi:Crp/Fnr family transcriptional regulator [Corallococcus exiguus]|jgi:CRP-like cAMP-binding protein|uniref:Transcriptional regulator MrpC n=14 Tax=Corallococcus TaxID=83461 RepID=H8MN67_CORCM|nr:MULTISPECIES: Crp/Fnr family transcriptional regulator MrpC [Corallococcus]RKH49744.1 Crp/Fnr family transcriptional regulator [Corallococcus sp. AB050B]RKI36918.1 Crp/Fnr family transcriptional regulator [Corallococcus sp. AB004]GMT99999.1 Crp/Fnr family transcriptional regulator [Corallococcus sp. KH5-1]GMU09143.1 Crp/Fnr family transcriptional regulator [Corallococcus sp. NO1]AFE09488.1 transcriptional regulator MrpC [Corallococcus coralloides DSM 2259]